MFWGKLTPAKGKEAEIQRHPDVIEMDKGELFLSSCVNILRNIYGFVDATNKGIASDKKGDYLPLYTYPATEYVSQFDYSQNAFLNLGLVHQLSFGCSVQHKLLVLRIMRNGIKN